LIEKVRLPAVRGPSAAHKNGDQFIAFADHRRQALQITELLFTDNPQPNVGFS
jgi:hypothetical protein